MGRKLDFFKDKIVVVTGGAGSIGYETALQLASSAAKEIRLIDNNESELFDIQQKLKSDPRFQFFCMDICSRSEMSRAFRGGDYCFHTAALKHVPSCEVSPEAAVRVNIEGILNIIRCADDAGFEKVLFTSSDKAVNPTNVMGTSKLLGERLISAADNNSKTIFASTRFGNVVGSRGSVVPIFINQILSGQAITLTDNRMTRFMMSKAEAVNLVIKSLQVSRGGEVFITKMPVMKIADLAEVLIEILSPQTGKSSKDYDIIETGARPGEKLWEELSTEEEAQRIVEGDQFLAVFPALSGLSDFESNNYAGMNFEISQRVYHSDRIKVMTKDEIITFLHGTNTLPSEV